MKVLRVLSIAVCFVSAMIITVFAETSSWPFLAEVNMSKNEPGIYQLNLPLSLLDKASADLSDVRLFDANDREIPFAVRVRRQIDDQEEIGGDIFNRAAVGTAAEVSVDIGEDPGEHNEVEIQTSGSNFRRRVHVEGSDSGKDWHTLTTNGLIFGFTSSNRSVDSNRVSYPTSRYRYLRVRVFADEVTDDRAPTISEVKVSKSVHEQGELTTWPIGVPSYQLHRNGGAHASSWTIDLGGRVPCTQLSLGIQDQSFSRPFYVEAVDDPQNPRSIASGELTRRLGEETKPLTITFDNEEYARKLRLLVTDYSNQTLTIDSIQASAPARELVFELKQPAALPLRLFAGTKNVAAPHYDFEKELSTKLSQPVIHVDVGSVVSNPTFVPEPLPLTERVPWMIYLVLGASSVALGLILLNLARAAMHRMPAKASTSENL